MDSVTGGATKYARKVRQGRKKKKQGLNRGEMGDPGGGGRETSESGPVFHESKRDTDVWTIHRSSEGEGTLHGSEGGEKSGTIEKSGDSSRQPWVQGVPVTNLGFKRTEISDTNRII